MHVIIFIVMYDNCIAIPYFKMLSNLPSYLELQYDITALITTNTDALLLRGIAVTSYKRFSCLLAPYFNSIPAALL